MEFYIAHVRVVTASLRGDRGIQHEVLEEQSWETSRGRDSLTLATLLHRESCREWHSRFLAVQFVKRSTRRAAHRRA